MDFEKISPEITDLFINKFTDRDWERWGFKEGSRDTILLAFMTMSMRRGRGDLFEAYFGAISSFNSGTAPHHVISAVIKSGMDNGRKAELTGRIIGKDGIGKVAEPYKFLELAAENGAAGAFDLLVEATGKDLHKDNEWILRHAAASGQKEMARHLVEKHAADINLAITTSRTLGHEQNWRFLDELRQELRPGEDSAPPTIASLSEALKALKAEMREMKAELTELRNPGRTLDKPALKGPQQP
jgi:hypothetical protein